jgi:hypothetical protein
MCLEVAGFGASWTPVSIALSTPSRACKSSLLQLLLRFPEGNAEFAANADS